MAVANVSHDKGGKIITKVPIRFKISLGLPGVFGDGKTNKPKTAQKLYYFLPQSRDENGEWAYDSGLAKELFGETDGKSLKELLPREIEIQLIGGNINNMVKSDLFFWDTSIGMKCSCGTTDRYLKEWCYRNDVKWAPPLSEVQSEAEMKYLIKTGEISQRLNVFLDEATKMVEVCKKAQTKKGADYELSVSHFIRASCASRMSKGEYKPYPCLYWRCPDYLDKLCKLNIRFFFTFKNHDIGDAVVLVTTSRKILQQIQWGLNNIAQRVVDGKSHNNVPLTLHGVPMRLVGQVEKSYYPDKTGKQHATKVFMVFLKGPSDNMIESAKQILDRAREVAEYYSGAIDIEFDEGDDLILAKERIQEFSDAGMRAKKRLDSIDKQSSMPEFKLEPEIPKIIADTPDIEYLKRINLAVEKDPDNVKAGLIRKVGEALKDMMDNPQMKKFKTAYLKSVESQEVTVEKILSIQTHLDNLGVKINVQEEYDKLKDGQLPKLTKTKKEKEN
ncbi:MAG: hypothetical protein WCY30_01700 [Candidatus Neomarinimicrobiota bacterium]|jgi:hypothetical protein